MTERHLRIAVLGTRGFPDVMGGVETHCQALYPRLAAKGHNITIFARKGYVHQDKPYVYQGVHVEPSWVPRYKNLEAILHTAYGLFKVVTHRYSFDILHIHAIGPSLLVPIARALGFKVVMTHHGPDYDRQKWSHFAKSMLHLGERLGCRYSGNVITVSKHIRNTVQKLYGRLVYYIPNGVVIPTLLTAGEAVRKWGLSPKRYILAVGRFVPEKGFHDLLEAFGRIETDWNLVLAGAADHEDSYSARLREMAARDNRVVLTGFISGRELVEIYSNAGFFVLPSYHEGLPIALLEAMSYDLPVITSDIPANRELVEPDETFPVGDVTMLTRRLETYLKGTDTVARRRLFVEKSFNWDTVADETEAVLLLTVKK